MQVSNRPPTSHTYEILTGGLLPLEFRKCEENWSNPYTRWWEKFDDVYNRFDTIQALDGQKDKRAELAFVLCMLTLDNKKLCCS